jgi:hypothetical protein
MQIRMMNVNTELEHRDEKQDDSKENADETTGRNFEMSEHMDVLHM